MAAQDKVGYQDEGVKLMSLAIKHLGINLYKELAKSKGNIFFSPLSLSSALAILFCGSSNETNEELRQVLGYDFANIENDEVKSFFRFMLPSLDHSRDSYTLTSANVSVNDCNFRVKAEFKKLLEESFKALTIEVDFCKEATKAVQKINEWVKDKTHGMIPQTLGSLDPNTVMIILNAIYFKAFWRKQFKTKDTFPQYFYNNGQDNQAKKVDMMHLKGSFSLAEMESFQALQLPYKGDETAMLIILPHERNGVGYLESKLSVQFLQDLRLKMSKTKVEIALPKFRLEYSKSLKNSFQNLGMKRIFCSGAHFSGISDSDDLLVSEINHKAVLIVNEEGCEAAVTTFVKVAKVSCGPYFIADHPFIFLILNHKTNMVLFMGKVEEL